MGTGAEVHANVGHVVIMMQENRSFDEYFGTLNGATGFSDPNAIPGVFSQPIPNSNPPSNLKPWPYDTASTEVTPGCNHHWDAMHAYWCGGQMNGWLSNQQPQSCMAYFTREGIPYHFALAQAFTVCDNYFASVLGPTGPNRLYLMSGGIGEPHANVSTPPDQNLQWIPYARILSESGITWAIYDEDPGSCPFMDLNALSYFSDWPSLKTEATYRPGQGRFEADVKSPNEELPQVSWIVPSWSDTEHPPASPAGIANVYSKVWSLIESNYWQDTVLIVNYDENDGAFDHVAPPVPEAGSVGEWLTQSGSVPPAAVVPSYPDYWPIGPGFRVPAFVISPWSLGGRVCSTQYDHTSTLKLLYLAFGDGASRGPKLEPTLTGFRWLNFGDFSEPLDFSSSGVPTGEQLPSLREVETWAARLIAERSQMSSQRSGTESAFPPALYPNKPLTQACASDGDLAPPAGCLSAPIKVITDALKAAAKVAARLTGG